jgi:rhodanese-related sulfurtransferase
MAALPKVVALAVCSLVAGCATAAGTPAPEPSPTFGVASDHTFDGDEHAPFISVAEVGARLSSESPRLVLIDVRSPGERGAGHIAGDVWIPLADMSQTGLTELAKHRESLIVLYCDCPWAEAAYASVAIREQGYGWEQIRVLEEGYSGWAAAGYEIVGQSSPCDEERRWPNACQGGET